MVKIEEKPSMAITMSLVVRKDLTKSLMERAVSRQSELGFCSSTSKK